MLMASSIGTHSCCTGFTGVGSFRSFRFHKERCTVHLLLHTHFYLDKKNTLVIHFCGYYSDLLDLNMLSKTTKKSNAYAARSCQPSVPC